jgi:hypothetical protein
VPHLRECLLLSLDRDGARPDAAASFFDLGARYWWMGRWSCQPRLSWRGSVAQDQWEVLSLLLSLPFPSDDLSLSFSHISRHFLSQSTEKPRICCTTSTHNLLFCPLLVCLLVLIMRFSKTLAVYAAVIGAVRAQSTTASSTTDSSSTSTTSSSAITTHTIDAAIIPNEFVPNTTTADVGDILGEHATAISGLISNRLQSSDSSP